VSGAEQAGQVVGLLERRGRFLVAEPFFESGRRMTVERDRRAKPGWLALLQVGGPGPRRRSAKVVRLIGRPEVARDVIEALMLSRGLRRSFPPGVERAAAEARDAVPGREASHPARRDLRDLTTFTIDPVTAKDFDDAISCESLGGERRRVWVHIADVTAYVRPGSAVDREAYRRGTSVYVPGAVEPMLPEPLSNDACSLVPGEDRLAVTVEIEYEGTTVRRAAFCRSVIRSDARLDYDRVDRVFAGEERAEEPWAQPLADARALSAALQARRETGGALVLDSPEPEYSFDGRGHLQGSTPREQTESHRLIEHLMIAANEQVARLLAERRVPTLYRVHERPEPEAIERLVAQLASLDVPTPPVRERMSSTQAAEAMAQISRMVDTYVRGRDGRGRRALTYLVLRALKQAGYTPRNLGHAGLGLTHYCHFTSPIRRYPDVVCHRALLSAIGAGEDAPRASALEEAGEWCSARERDAMTIERDADDVAQCFLLARRLDEQGWGEVFEGEVTGVIGAGAFVAFGDSYEGLVPVRRLGGDWWEVNEEGTLLRGEQSGRAVRLGDAIRVRVDRVDTARGRVDLVPAEGDAGRRERGGRGRPTR
jgi:ribonuclease R